MLWLTCYVFFISINNWQNAPTKYFRDIKEILTGTGNLSKIERNLLSEQIVTHSMAIKATRMAMPDFSDITLTVVVAIGTVIVAYFFWDKFTQEKPKKDEEGKGSDKMVHTPIRLTLHTDLVKSIVTVDGLVISILGGFLISTKLKNPIIIDGFLIIIVSLILALIAHTSIVKAIRSENESKKEIEMNKELFEKFSRTSGLAFWFLVLGLLVVTFSLL